ncbi:MAG: YeeE/YedE family protein [Immundisolibacteraceae bacterium]|nr:YeeE/YedE family protein [Immundisolibacteraceae bacterium]
MMTEFTPVSALAGGMLIGLSATVLLLFNGRIAGISGIVNGLFAADDDRLWRVLFLVSMVLSAGLAYHLTPLAFSLREGFPLWWLLPSGFLVGFGTRMGGGCTSGHGICGLGRLSKRSLVATASFFLVGLATASVSALLMAGV